MKFIEDIMATESEDWQDGIMWLVYTLLGGLFPFWGSAILLLLFNKWQGINPFVDHGEFAIYSAPLLAIALFVANRKSSGFQSRGLFSIIAVICLLFSSFLFAGVSSIDFFAPIKISLNLGFLRKASLYLFFISVLEAFVAYVFDLSRPVPNLEGLKQHNLNELSKTLDKIRRRQK